MAAHRSERYAGALVGQALGDALGFVVEGRGAAECRQHVQTALRERRAGWRRLPFQSGQYSDDTQLARELAASLVARRRFDADDYARRIAALFVEDRIVGRGLTTEQAALRIAAGVPWHAAGTPAPAAGNGSAMRVAPLGLLHAHDLTTLHDEAVAQGRITHADPRCTAGTLAIARAVAGALRGELAQPKLLAEAMADWAAPHDPVLAEALQALPGWLVLPPHEAAARIAGLGYGAGERPPEAGDAIGPFVTPSVAWSLYAALRCPADYEEAIATAIAVGGDVDTTAAMTGAIVGAAVGLGGLPRELAVLVHDRGSDGFDSLIALASRLAGLASGS
jgi:ADP-ribosylglycohydrolase